MSIADDIAFSRWFSAQVCDLYQEAKKYSQIAPVLTLVNIRKIVSLLCNELIDEFSISAPTNKLYDKIEEVRLSRKVLDSTVDILHNLRILGNRGAHNTVFNPKDATRFHSFYKTIPSTHKMAVQSLCKLRLLMDDCYFILCLNPQPLNYKVIDVEKISSLQEVLVDFAVIEKTDDELLKRGLILSSKENNEFNKNLALALFESCSEECMDATNEKAEIYLSKGGYFESLGENLLKDLIIKRFDGAYSTLAFHFKDKKMWDEALDTLELAIVSGMPNAFTLSCAFLILSEKNIDLTKFDQHPRMIAASKLAFEQEYLFGASYYISSLYKPKMTKENYFHLEQVVERVKDFKCKNAIEYYEILRVEFNYWCQIRDSHNKEEVLLIFDNLEKWYECIKEKKLKLFFNSSQVTFIEDYINN